MLPDRNAMIRRSHPIKCFCWHVYARIFRKRINTLNYFIQLGKILPPAFADLMTENPEQSVTLFEGRFLHRTTLLPRP